MNLDTARYLNALNEEFYREVHESFSATRSVSWPGWKRALIHVDCARRGEEKPLRVLDLACGNMRFEAFLREALPEASLEAHCVDNCLALAEPSLAQRFTGFDVVEWLFSESSQSLSEAVGAEPCDLAVCFGFFHHVPTQRARLRLLYSLMAALKPGGIAVVSFWRFMENQRLASKASVSHEKFLRLHEARGLDRAQLEAGDYLLAWQDRGDVCRYCHHFTSDEVSNLLAHLDGEADLLDRYYEDGRDGMTNEYLVLRRREISEISS